MPEFLQKVDGLVDRLANRLIWRLAQKKLAVATDVPLVSFTFDDVPDSALHQGAEILERHGVRGTFYIAGGLEGRVEPDRTLITAAGCEALSKREHEVGCHTFSHSKIRRLTGGRLRATSTEMRTIWQPVASLSRQGTLRFPTTPPGRWHAGNWGGATERAGPQGRRSTAVQSIQ